MSVQPNPKRVVAGRVNRKLAGPISEAGREKLRAAAIANRPWDYATGPKSPEGKQRAALNGKTRQSGPLSVRELRREQAAARVLIVQLIEARGAVE